MAVLVLICDDQAAFRAAAREVVNATDGFQVVGEVGVDHVRSIRGKSGAEPAIPSAAARRP